ncbi:MAG: threonine synthase [Clostridia bacterium]|nr:threonine synthase [Clostridia bacterium]
MRFFSTRNAGLDVTGAQAISKGISDDGGLFVPASFPEAGLGFISSLLPLPYEKRAARTLGLFLTDYSAEELEGYARAAYSSFPENAAPVVKVGSFGYFLELWRGPTCAFKDMALQMLPHLLTGANAKLGGGLGTMILTATSGDTGKAALEGFKDVPGTKIMVFYPADGVSAMQKLQMGTQEGGNVCVYGVEGNFDDCQTAVKRIFTDPGVKAGLAARGWAFSSANSINFGRLAPQIAYYFSAYCDLVNSGVIALGDRININVPTGNFGNILAAYYAFRCGLPVNRFICSSNSNDVLTEFLKTGHYSLHRPFYTTVSPSMDILVSSNLERLIFDLCGSDKEVKRLYGMLASAGEFDVSDEVLGKITQLFWADQLSEDETKKTIADIFAENAYLADTHTAVAAGVYKKYAAATGDATPCVTASTANPYKFPAAVLEAITGEKDCGEWEAIDRLESLTGTPAPAPIKALREKEVRFTGTLKDSGMADAVLAFASDRAG